MKKSVLICVLLAASTTLLANDHVASTYCELCDLQTPIPEDWTRHELESWRTGTSDLLGPKPVAPGDFVTICNASYCAKYSYNLDGSWSNGTATKLGKAGDGKTCTPSSPPRGGGGGGGPGAADPGGTVTVGPMLPPLNPGKVPPSASPLRRCK